MSRTPRIVGWTAVLIMMAVVTVGAHLAATKSVPAADAVLVESPDHLQVWFTQDPDPAVSRLTLEGPDGAVEVGETVVTEEKSLRAAVARQLVQGEYTLKWRTAGDDGHVRRGSIAFRVSAAD